MGSKIERVCPICATVYLVDTTYLKQGRKITCSRKCSYILRGRKRRTRVERICRCHKKFYVTASVAAKGAGIYCSRDCRYPPQIGTCLHCGKTFRCSPSAHRKYCSEQCANASQEKLEFSRKAMIARWQNPETKERMMQGIKRRSESEEWRSAPHFQKGEAHPRYKGNKHQERIIEVSKYEYKKWHRDVLRQCNYTCQHCKKRGGRLIAHHIKSWADFPELRYDVNNGIALCEECHDEVHGRKHRPKHYFCIDCGKEKTDGRSPYCHSCATKNSYRKRKSN